MSVSVQNPDWPVNVCTYSSWFVKERSEPPRLRSLMSTWPMTWKMTHLARRANRCELSIHWQRFDWSRSEFRAWVSLIVTIGCVAHGTPSVNNEIPAVPNIPSQKKQERFYHESSSVLYMGTYTAQISFILQRKCCFLCTKQNNAKNKIIRSHIEPLCLGTNSTSLN